LYSLVRVVPFQTDWCWRPNVWPDSCPMASATALAEPPARFLEKTKQVLDALL
jgi:hypothetical protein